MSNSVARMWMTPPQCRNVPSHVAAADCPLPSTPDGVTQTWDLPANLTDQRVSVGTNVTYYCSNVTAILSSNSSEQTLSCDAAGWSGLPEPCGERPRALRTDNMLNGPSSPQPIRNLDNPITYTLLDNASTAQCTIQLYDYDSNGVLFFEQHEHWFIS